MGQETEISADTLESLGAKKLARLVLEETARNAAFKRQVAAALAGQTGPEAVAKIVDRRLAGLERAKSLVDWNRARVFRDDLQSLNDVIEAELIAAAPTMAADRLLRFIATHETVFERVDDSDGSVQAIYYQAIEMIGRTADALAETDAALLPDRIMSSLGESTHGYLVDLAEAVVPHLPGHVLEALLCSRQTGPSAARVFRSDPLAGRS